MYLFYTAVFGVGTELLEITNIRLDCVNYYFFCRVGGKFPYRISVVCTDIDICAVGTGLYNISVAFIRIGFTFGEI